MNFRCMKENKLFLNVGHSVGNHPVDECSTLFDCKEYLSGNLWWIFFLWEKFYFFLSPIVVIPFPLWWTLNSKEKYVFWKNTNDFLFPWIDLVSFTWTSGESLSIHIYNKRHAVGLLVNPSCDASYMAFPTHEIQIQKDSWCTCLYHRPCRGCFLRCSCRGPSR